MSLVPACKEATTKCIATSSWVQNLLTFTSLILSVVIADVSSWAFSWSPNKVWKSGTSQVSFVSLLLTHLKDVAVSWNFAIKFSRSGNFQIYLHVLLYILGFELGQVNQLFKHYSHPKLDWLHHPLTDSECKRLHNNLLKLQGNNHYKNLRSLSLLQRQKEDSVMILANVQNLRYTISNTCTQTAH